MRLSEKQDSDHAEIKYVKGKIAKLMKQELELLGL